MTRSAIAAVVLAAAVLAAGCGGDDDGSGGVAAGGLESGALAAGLPAESLPAGASTTPAGITVVGTGSVKVAPDVAEWSFGVQASADTASAALADASEATERVVAALRDAGFAQGSDDPLGRLRRIGQGGGRGVGGRLHAEGPLGHVGRDLHRAGADDRDPGRGRRRSGW